MYLYVEKPHDPLTIDEIVKILSEAERIGGEEDIPEGNRYIMLSDTLANKIINVLSQYTK